MFEGGGIFGFTVEADFSHQALGDDSFDGGCNQEGFQPQVEETGDGAWGIVGVERAEDEVAGEGGLHGDFGGFLIADFADQDDIGVLAQHCAEDASEGEFDFRFDLALDDAVDVIFDRVFGGDQLAAGVVQFSECGIERGCFTRTCRAGDDHDSVGLVNELARDGEVFVAHAEFVEIEADVGAVEDAHHDALAEHCGEDADAEVDGLVVDAEFDAAVLRKAAFGDIEIGHDLDAAADGGGDVGRRGHHFVEHAVDAVSHLEFALEGLEVNVGGLVLDRLKENEVDELADGVGIGGFFEAVDVDRFAAIFQVFQRIIVLQFAEDIADAFGGGLVILGNEAFELLGIGSDLGDDLVLHEGS